jgi:serine phosphatase RsbU (regulator of sigma subunit)
MSKFGNLLAKYRKRLILPVSLILFVIGFINLYFIFVVTPQSNDECLWLPRKIDNRMGVYFNRVKFEGVTWTAGIRDGDELLAINNTYIDNNTQRAQIILNNVSRGDSALYTVSRDGRIFETKVEVKKLINFSGLAATLLAIGWLIVGFIVINAKPDGFTQILFYRIGAMLILYSTMSLFGYSLNNPTNPVYQSLFLIILVDITWSIAGVFLPFMIVHFFWIFPQKTKIIQRRYTTRILYLAPVVILGFSIIYKMFFVFPTSSVGAIFLYIFFIGILLMSGIVVGLISLFINYTRLKTPRERNAIFVILISYTIALAGIIYTTTLANVFADTIFNSPEQFMPILLIAILPIAFGYSIFRYSLMDVSDVVKNTILYGAATISVAVIYFIIIYFIGQQLSYVIGTEYQGITAAAIFIIFAVVFQSTKDRFQEIITRKFYPEQFAYQKVLIKFSNDISTIVGKENILDSAAATFVDSLKIEKFGIALKNNDQNNYILKRSHGIKDKSLDIPNQRNTIQKFVIHRNSLRQLPVIDRTEYERVFPDSYEKIIDEGIFTIIPLTIKSKIIGLLLFGVKYSGSQFAGKDLELLIATSNQLAASIENARLYESETKKLKIDIDLENARKIQEKLLPGFIPKVKGLDIAGKMIPAMQVGGDYYDLIRISGTKLYAVIGDVSGKGLAASFYMSKLQTMVQLQAKKGGSPKDILIEINKEIYGHIERNWFITVSLALFDTYNKTVTYCRAGHTPLIILNGEKSKYIQPSGIGLGLERGEIFESSLEEITISLSDNDLFVLFSDGVNESMNDLDELYGMNRFDEILLKSSHMLAESALTNILKSIDKFRDGRDYNDDITLVLLKYNAE